MNKAHQYHSDLGALLLGIHSVPSALNTQIHGLVSDSRAVKQGDLFIALAGINTSAEHYVGDAISRGAAAVLIDCDEHDSGKDREAHEDAGAVELYVPNLRAHVGEIAHRFFHRPSEEVQVVGVTGTNGKTSIVNYLAQFFASLGVSTAVIGTLGYGLCNQSERLIGTNHTTPGVVDVHRYLAHLRDAGAEFVAIEVSSHGLDQGRVAGVHFEGAVFTNLSREHLDYHNTMEEYAEAKAKLFAWPSLRYVAINADDEFAKAMFQNVQPDVKKIRFGMKEPAEVRAKDSKFGLMTRCTVDVGMQQTVIATPILGEFNLYNLLAVLAVAHAKACSDQELAKINQVESVAGRMEMFESPGGPVMIVDYAHTPDALENVLKALASLDLGRVITVFGCGGDRDIGKRKEMGSVAANYSNYCVLTNDNPRSESPEKILADIAQGFEKNEEYTLIADRAQAIAFAYEKASEGDIVLVAGKGHEDYQETNGQRIYFSDADQCKALLGLGSDKVEVRT